MTLNGEKYGLFLNIETLDEVSLPRWFPNFGEPGHLYEADAAGTDVRPGEASTFEVDEGDDEDLSDLEALIAAANEDEGDWSDAPAGGLMFNECLADADCKELYLEGLVDVHCANGDLDQGAHAAQLAAMLGPYQEEEDESRRGYTGTEIEEEVREVEGFDVERAGLLEDNLTEEGELGDGEDPCASPPVEEAGGASASVPPSTSPGPVFFGRTRVRVDLVPDAGVAEFDVRRLRVPVRS